MKKKRNILTSFLLILFSFCSALAQQSNIKSGENISHLNSLSPFLGAQVFIEPGQTAADIDSWFRILKESDFSFCRIRMFESYMRNADGTWDFSLFDNAFRSAEKYGIKIFGTIFPYTEKTDIGGFKFPRDSSHLNSIASFIKALVLHFSKYNSLYGWVLINEPGTGGYIPRTIFTEGKFQEWRKSHPREEYTKNGYPVLVDLSDQEFLLDYNTWYLNWLASEIRKYDTVHELHVNNHQIFQNCAEYNFPAWRKFLTSMGGSAHAAWHFGYFTRQQYAYAMSANSEIIKSGAGDLPWFMTELQGGNNTYSGAAPMCPTKEEIAQWLWLITATNGKGAIFWTLNPRSSGIEAGEWALLDFRNEPSDRMKAASKVIRTIDGNKDLFSKSGEVESGINILYVRQSLWAEKKMATGSANDYEARKPGGVMKSAISYFEALSQMGINAGLKAFEEFDFSHDDYSGSAIILSHQISIPGSYADSLEKFVRKGGKLIVDGLSGFFDEHLLNTMETGFDFEELFGGEVSEYKLVDNIYGFNWKDYVIPAHLWRGTIFPESGSVAALYEGNPVALRNQHGKGEVLWIPSLIGLGSRISGDYSPLQQFLESELRQCFINIPVHFSTPQDSMLMKTMKSGSSLITVVINKSEDAKDVLLDFNGKKVSGRIIFANMNGEVSGTTLQINPEETMVIVWE